VNGLSNAKTIPYYLGVIDPLHDLSKSALCQSSNMYANVSLFRNLSEVGFVVISDSVLFRNTEIKIFIADCVLTCTALAGCIRLSQTDSIPSRPKRSWAMTSRHAPCGYIHQGKAKATTLTIPRWSPTPVLGQPTPG
jgi:hypothetical protein